MKLFFLFEIHLVLFLFPHFVQLSPLSNSNDSVDVKPQSYKDFLLQWKRLTKFSYERIKVLHESFQNDLKLGKAFLMDSKLWMDLDGKEVYSRYPGIIFLDSYKKPKSILDEFNIKDITEASLDTLEMVYEKMITSIHVLCLNITRYGNIDDGGWEVCTSQPYTLQDGCLVFSFGINFDFSFDDDVGISNNCTVFAFDPSMSSEDHVRSDNVYFYQIGLGPLNSVTKDRWVVKSFRSIIEILQLSNNVIDVLKIDIEYDEWDSLRMMINDGSLLNVKQLLFEVHTINIKDEDWLLTDGKKMEEFIKMYSILADLESKCHFRKFYFHENYYGQRKLLSNDHSLNCCYELYYINLRFL